MAREFKTLGFNKGIHNLLNPENIAQDAAADALNWRTRDDRVEVTLGRDLFGLAGGTEGAAGQIKDFAVFDIAYNNFKPSTYSNNFFAIRKKGTELQVFTDHTTNGKVWTTIGNQSSATDLFEEDERVHFGLYQSLAGIYVYACGTENGPYRIAPFVDPLVNADMATDIYVAANNYRGSFLFDKSRTILWGRRDDKTGVYLSKIDPQGTNYTTITNEHLGTGDIDDTLIQATGDQQVFSIVITTPDGDFAGLQDGTFKDFNGDIVTADAFNENGYKGYIDYAEGKVVLQKETTGFSGSSTVNYQYENPTDGGVWDFRFSAPRVAAEGDIISQNEAGSEIFSIIPYQGSYISLKAQGGYKLTLSDDDTTATNIVFSRSLSLINGRSAIATDIGIIYLDTGDPAQPRLVVLQQDAEANVLNQIQLAKHFDFGKFNFNDIDVDIFNTKIMIACKTLQSANNSLPNDRIIVYDYRLDSVDVVGFPASRVVPFKDNVYIGGSIVQDTFHIFSGFDDMEGSIGNYWVGKQEMIADGVLKRLRRLRLKGRITVDAKLKVFIGYDNGSFEQVGTITGKGTYVDSGGTYAFGTEPIGQSEVGGGSDITNTLGSSYFVELKIKTPKFRVRQIKFEMEGIGFVSVDMITDTDIRYFQGRMPNKYRIKQNVSLDGESTDQ